MPILRAAFPIALLLCIAPLTACAQPASRDCVPADAAFSPAGWQTDFCTASVDLGEIRAGGPPRDGIPPIDEPRFIPAGEADAWLEDREPILFFEHNGEARAYPIQVLMWHEIVNDVVGGTPVTVTFCPLCHAALVFVRPEAGGEVLTFGTSGNLRKSDLVMWDRQTETWWQQFGGEAIVGELTGMKLELLPSSLIAWETFRERHPAGDVLSRDTGHDRPYGRNPYVGYDDVDRGPFLYDGPVGEALRPMDRIVGVQVDDAARAYPLAAVRQRGAVNDELGGTPLAILWTPGTASSLDDPRIASGRDVGSTGAFDRRLRERTLTFNADGEGRFRDAQTGTTWTILGEAVAGPLRGERLRAIPHHDIFWFVWSAFQPEGEFDPLD
jgi:hypothetical protein